MRWIIDAARAKKGKDMRFKLADELIAAANNEGEAIKKRDNTHKMAEANKAFAHSLGNLNKNRYISEQPKTGALKMPVFVYCQPSNLMLFYPYDF